MSNESAIRREVGAIALMFTGLGSIIGSGWLFGAWRAAQLAGPGAVYSWIIGAVIILFVAFTGEEKGWAGSRVLSWCPGRACCGGPLSSEIGWNTGTTTGRPQWAS